MAERQRVVGEEVFSSPWRLKGRKGGLGAGDECAFNVAPLLPQHPTMEKPRLKDLEFLILSIPVTVSSFRTFC